MSIRGIGIPVPGGGTSSGSSTAASKRAQGGRGIITGDGTDNIVRSLIVSGLLRGRNLDGNGGNMEVWALSCPAIIASTTINARGDAQQFAIEADIWECDVIEVQFDNVAGSTPAALATMQGGIYTEPPQSDGTPYPDTAIVEWTQSYSGWAGGYRKLIVPAIRQSLQPVDFWWIPKVKPSTDFTFRLRLAAYCEWFKGSADPTVNVDT